MAKVKRGLKKELEEVEALMESAREKARAVFLRFIKIHDLEDLKFLSTEEYDDNNYFTYIRPQALGSAEFDVSDLHDLDLVEFNFLVQEIIKKDMMESEREEVIEALNLEYPLNDLVDLMQEIARRGLDPKKTIEAILDLHEQFPSDLVPLNHIQSS